MGVYAMCFESVRMPETKTGRREDFEPPVKHFLLDLDMFGSLPSCPNFRSVSSVDVMLIGRLCRTCVAPPPCSLCACTAR